MNTFRSPPFINVAIMALVFSGTILVADLLIGQDHVPSSTAVGVDSTLNIVVALTQASAEHQPLHVVPIEGYVRSEADRRAMLHYVWRHEDYRAYHVLFMLRSHFRDTYERIPAIVRARVLCSALATTKWFNDWGLLDPKEPFDGEAGDALLGTREASLPYLEAMLNDKSSAKVFGSEESTMAVVYQYRRADYAYRYAMLLLGREPVFHSQVAERDKLINSLRQELSSGKAGGNPADAASGEESSSSSGTAQQTQSAGGPLPTLLP